MCLPETKHESMWNFFLGVFHPLGDLGAISSLVLSSKIINSSLTRHSDDNRVILLLGRFTLYCMLNIMRLLRLKM